MIHSIELRFLTVLGLLGSCVLSQTCTSRPASQLIRDSSFEDGTESWTGHDSPISTVPTYPAHSGTHMSVMTASYIKSPDTTAVITTAYNSQNIFALPGRTYTFSASYRIQSYEKGASCPSDSYALTPCRLIITYAFQTIKIVDITSPIPGTAYVEYTTPFLPSTGGRYIQFELRCEPASPLPTPIPSQCAEATLLLDDVTFSDPGWDCSWRFWGCFTDSVDRRSLPIHGTIPGWPATTTVEACCNACANQGYWYAGLEYGNECWCGNGLGGTNVTGTGADGSGGCSMRCEGFSQNVCGGPDRLSVYHQANWGD